MKRAEHDVKEYILRAPASQRQWNLTCVINYISIKLKIIFE